ncbi:MAG: MerR family transcriptional regulator [Deltaproteobacteria bacterium]|nr:MerR family transcriptional regulator [Deltaproteobacteria bacterium]
MTKKGPTPAPGAAAKTAAPLPERLSAYTISRLGRLFGLSRSTLLYYDRIGLLKPTGRTRAGYRCYAEKDRHRLERICGFRRAGIALAEIPALIDSDEKPAAAILERRFHEIGEEIIALKTQQTLLSRMLKGMAAGNFPPALDKAMWVAMLRAAGMDDRAMERWHIEFEARAPEAHGNFLSSLGIPETEVQEIRKGSRQEAEKEALRRP